MSTCISGWVEIWLEYSDKWYPAIEVWLLGMSDYEIFGLLFGVRNYAGFEPVAPGRGIPADASESARKEFLSAGTDAHSPSWILWSEIKRIPPETAAAEQRIALYQQQADGSWHSSIHWHHADHPNAHAGLREWRSGEYLYKVEPVTWATVIDDNVDWRSTTKLLDALAELYGNDGVRIVAWFD